MRNRPWVLAGKLGGAFVLVTLCVALPGLAVAHDSPCHADHTCPSDVTPPDYACGDLTATCSAPNSPDPAQPNAAPALGGPPSADECRNYEIFYDGTICKQVLAGTSPSPFATAPVATVSPVASATPVATVPSTGIPDPIGSAPAALPVTAGELGTAALAVWAAALAASVFLVAATWRVFTKAGEPGWAALIPIYGTLVYLKIAQKPRWWIFILWLIVPVFIANRDVAKQFGRSEAFAAGLTLLPFIFLPIIAFGHADFRRIDTGPRPLPL